MYRTQLYVACLVSMSFLLIGEAVAQGWFQDFEDGVSPFGFTLDYRFNETLGFTENIDTEQSDDTFEGSTSAFLSDEWDTVSRDLGIDEGIVTVWFYDTGYEGPNSNAIRLRTEEDDAETPYWPLDFVAVELKGRRTGHGSDVIPYYYVNRPCPDCNAMGVDFGYDITTGERVERTYNTWHEVSFVIDDGVTLTSIDNHPTSIAIESAPSRIELLCRSGWYVTRPGDGRTMLWDDIFIAPKMHSTGFDTAPEWMTPDPNTSLVFEATPSPNLPASFVPLLETGQVARFPGPEMKLSAPWDVDQGMIEVWFFDPNIQAAGYKDIVRVSNAANPEEYLRISLYSHLMGNPAETYYVATHETPKGGTYGASRSEGWHRLIFRKVKGELSLSVDGISTRNETTVWDDPPDNLLFEILSGNSRYPMGSAMWYSRIVMTGENATGVRAWELY